MAHRTQGPRSSRRGDRLDAVLLLVVVALCAAVLAGFAWTRPTRSPATLAYTQSGELSYTASTGATSVYGSSGLKTGQPIYSSQISTVQLSYAYRFESTSPAALKGTEQLVATIDNGQGVTRTIRLQPVTQFSGNHFSATGTLSLPALQAIAGDFSRVTGLGEQNFTVTVSPDVHIKGLLGPVHLKQAFNPAATFVLRSNLLAPSSSGRGAAVSTGPSVDKQLDQTSNGSVPVPGGQKATFAGVPAWDVRIGSLALMGAALVAAILLGLPLLWEATSDDEHVRIGRRYGSSLVEVDALPDTPGSMTVELASFEGLRQVARRLECPILRRIGTGADVYAVVDNGTLYRYSQPPRPKSSRAATGGRKAATRNHSVTVTGAAGRPS